MIHQYTILIKTTSRFINVISIKEIDTRIHTHSYIYIYIHTYII